MRTVKIVANKKTGLLYQPTTSGKWYRVQVSATGVSERDGFFSSVKQVGFAYMQTEEMAKALVASAVDGAIPGKVVYVDQLTPITEEAKEYGKQYPYPFRFNGTELTLDQRLQVQAACVQAGLSLMQSGQAIYRKKIYTTDLTRQSVILSPDNMDDVNAFIATVLSASTSPDTAKQERLAALKAIPKAKRTQAEKLELAELED